VSDAKTPMSGIPSPLRIGHHNEEILGLCNILREACLEREAAFSIAKIRVHVFRVPDNQVQVSVPIQIHQYWLFSVRGSSRRYLREPTILVVQKHGGADIRCAKAGQDEIRPAIVVDIADCNPGELTRGGTSHNVGRTLERPIPIAQGDQIARSGEIHLAIVVEVAYRKKSTGRRRGGACERERSLAVSQICHHGSIRGNQQIGLAVAIDVGSHQATRAG
jgi:hypothetical protein